MRNAKQGLTLLEVIIAMAILVATSAVLGQLIFLGEKQATKAQLVTEAQSLCHNRINEIMAGLVPLEPIENEAAAVDSPWDVTVQLEPLTGNGLVAVTVIVREHQEQTGPVAEDNLSSPIEFRLVRWLYQDMGESSESEFEGNVPDSSVPDSSESEEGSEP